MDLAHHSYILVGDISKAESAALEMASKALGAPKNSLSSSPDFFFLKEETFGIDSARVIREKSSGKSFGGRGRVFVIETDSLTKEATNALLKTFEETAGANYFFLLVPTLASVLETLRSRMALLKFYPEAEVPDKQKKFIGEFLKASVSKRMEMAKNISADKKKLGVFLDDLEIFLREKYQGLFPPEMVYFLDNLSRRRSLLFFPPSSPRLISESLFFILPKL